MDSLSEMLIKRANKWLNPEVMESLNKNAEAIIENCREVGALLLVQKELNPHMNNNPAKANLCQDCDKRIQPKRRYCEAHREQRRKVSAYNSRMKRRIGRKVKSNA